MQYRLHNLSVARKDGKKTVEETLQGAGHLIRFIWLTLFFFLLLKCHLIRLRWNAYFIDLEFDMKWLFFLCDLIQTSLHFSLHEGEMSYPRGELSAGGIAPGGIVRRGICPGGGGNARPPQNRENAKLFVVLA